jgi:ketosteroid isomerase-like protein
MQRPVGPGRLSWQPAYAVISSAGDLGFTTGPFQFRRSATDTVAGVGQYATVWEKKQDGQWKFLVDLGTEMKKPGYEVLATEQQVMPAIIATTSMDEIMKLEEQLNRDFEINGSKALVKYMTGKTWSNINGNPPLRGNFEGELGKLLSSTFPMKATGGKIADSGDLAYVYGNTFRETAQENYMRVWKKEKDHWVIALLVVR